MHVIDEQGNRIDAPDYESGYVEERSREVIHRYVVDVQEQRHFEVVAEYPETGGRDVESVVDVEEQGHWETRLAGTGEIIRFEGSIPRDAPREQEIRDIEMYLLYKRRSPEELDEIQRGNEKARRRSDFEEKGPDRLDAAEAAQADLDEAICTLYELMLEGDA